MTQTTKTEVAPIEKTVLVARPVEEAFRIYTEELKSWWPLDSHARDTERRDTAVLEPRVGGRLYERTRDGEELDWGEVQVWDPPHRLVHTWHLGRPETATEVEVRFAPEGDGTRVELVHRGRNTETSDDGLYGFYARNVTLSYCYLHDLGRVPILMREWNGMTVEYCYIARNSSSPVNHAEGVSDSGSDNVVIRNNVWKDIEGTGFIVILGNGGAADNWQIYGNVFFHSAQYGAPPNNEGVAGVIRVLNDASNASVANNWTIHNNSLINIQGLWSGFRIDAGTNNVAFNNLWHNSVRTAHTGVSLSHSWYFNTVPDGDSVSVQMGTGNPFRDISNEDFHLTAATAPGRLLGSPYGTDMEGSPRGADGVWDRGALERSGP